VFVLPRDGETEFINIIIGLFNYISNYKNNYKNIHLRTTSSGPIPSLKHLQDVGPYHSTIKNPLLTDLLTTLSILS